MNKNRDKEAIIPQAYTAIVKVSMTNPRYTKLFKVDFIEGETDEIIIERTRYQFHIEMYNDTVYIKENEQGVKYSIKTKLKIV